MRLRTPGSEDEALPSAAPRRRAGSGRDALADRAGRRSRPHQQRIAQGAPTRRADRAAGRRPDGRSRGLDHRCDARALGAHRWHPARGGGRPGRRLPPVARRARRPSRVAQPLSHAGGAVAGGRRVTHHHRPPRRVLARMRPCSSMISSRPPPPWPPRARGSPRSRRSRTACGAPDRARSRSRSATSPASYASGVPGVGWASLRNLPPPAGAPSLTVDEVDRAFAAIEAASGTGSAAVRREGIERPLHPRDRRGAAVPRPARRRRAPSGRARGRGDGRRGRSRRGRRRRRASRRDAGRRPAAVAEAALAHGAAALAAVRLQVGRPVQPMLAATRRRRRGRARATGEAAVEWKLDGGAHPGAPRRRRRARLHAQPQRRHRRAVPEVVEAVRALPLRSVVLDGEAIALRADGRPQPFQDTMSRVRPRRRRGAPAAPLTAFFFDVLHLDGATCSTCPRRRARSQRSTRVVPGGAGACRASSPTTPPRPRRSSPTRSPRGHEGVMVKALDAPYEAGRRGAGWLKVKPRAHARPRRARGRVGPRPTAGLAVEPPSRRARPGRPDGFVMLGKTFKGLTDELLTWQTEQLLELGSRRDGSTVVRASGARRRDRLRRRADELALPRRHGAALRPRRRATAPTSGPTRPTRSRPCARCTRRAGGGAA